MRDFRTTEGRRLLSPLASIAAALAIATLAIGCTTGLPSTNESNLIWEVTENSHLVIHASGTLSTLWGRAFEWEGADYRSTYLIGERLSGVSDEVFRSHSSDHIVIQAEGAFRIGNQCFQGSTARCIDLSQTAVETLGHHCFANTTNLEAIHLPNTIKMIDVGAFDFTTAKIIYWYGTRGEWESVEYKGDNDILNSMDVICVEDDMVFDDYGNGWWRINDERMLELISTDAWVGGAGGTAYPWKRQDFQSVIVAGSTSYLSAYAFAEKELKEVMILPSTCVECGMGMFAGSSIDRVDLANTSLTEVGLDFCYQAQIKELFLPTTLKQIGLCAFQDSTIETIYFAGTCEQWQRIIVEKGNDALRNTRIVCLDGMVIG